MGVNTFGPELTFNCSCQTDCHAQEATFANLTLKRSYFPKPGKARHSKSRVTPHYDDVKWTSI